MANFHYEQYAENKFANNKWHQITVTAKIIIVNSLHDIVATNTHIPTAQYIWSWYIYVIERRSKHLTVATPTKASNFFLLLFFFFHLQLPLILFSLCDAVWFKIFRASIYTAPLLTNQNRVWQQHPHDVKVQRHSPPECQPVLLWTVIVKYNWAMFALWYRDSYANYTTSYKVSLVEECLCLLSILSGTVFSSKGSNNNNNNYNTMLYNISYCLVSTNEVQTLLSTYVPCNTHAQCLFRENQSTKKLINLVTPSFGSKYPCQINRK